MARINHLFLLICILTGFLSCSRPHPITDNRLSEAERLIEEHHDSALNILESIPSDELATESDRALFGMLYTQALDKNHLNPQDSALITMAANYYGNINDPYRQTVSTYYLGRVLFLKENYTKAIINFFKAKQIAEKNGYDFWAGMSCRGISDTYHKTLNTAEEVKFANKEYEYLKRSGRQPYLNYALLDLGQATGNNEDRIKSISIGNQLLDSAAKYDDSYLRYTALQLIAHNYIQLNKYHDAYSLLKEVCSDESSDLIDSLNLCHAMIETGKTVEALAMFKGFPAIESPLKSQVRYKIAKYSHNYIEALEESEYLDSITYLEYRKSVSPDLTSPVVEFLELQKKLKDSELVTANLIAWLIAVGSTLTIIIIIGISVFSYNLQKKKLKRKIIFAEQLQQELNKSQQENLNSAENIKYLLSSKYELLEELCSVTLQGNDSKNKRKKIADKVMKLIDDMSLQSERVKNLERQVDRMNDNLISDFKKDLPGLKDADYLLFLFSALGFSAPTISLFLNEDKIDAIYNRKRRLKNKIRQLDEPKQDRYLKNLQ